MRRTAFLLLLLGLLPAAGHAENDRQDHKAQILRVTGKAKILKHTTGEWEKAAQGTVIEAGDQIITQKKSLVELAYDAKLQNIGRIEANTQAQFVSIEPTDIHLSDGSIFNMLDGLESGQNYQITTPTAVAAVRGTHFDVEFDSDEKQMDVDVFEDEKPGLGSVDILPPGGGGVPFQITEGNGAAFNDANVQSGQIETNPVSEEQAENADEAARDAAELREENGGAGNQGQGTGSQGESGQEQTQGEFALKLVEEVGLDLLPPGASGQDAIDFLTSLGVVPEGGWKADQPMTDEFLRSFFGKEGTGLTREQLIEKLKELVGQVIEKDQNVFVGAGHSSS